MKMIKLKLIIQTLNKNMMNYQVNIKKDQILKFLINYLKNLKKLILQKLNKFLKEILKI